MHTYSYKNIYTHSTHKHLGVTVKNATLDAYTYLCVYMHTYRYRNNHTHSTHKHLGVTVKNAHDFVHNFCGVLVLLDERRDVVYHHIAAILKSQLAPKIVLKKKTVQLTFGMISLVQLNEGPETVYCIPETVYCISHESVEYSFSISGIQWNTRFL